MSDDVLSSPADRSGREVPFVSLVLGGFVEDATIENCCCDEREHGESGRSGLSNRGTVTSWIPAPGPGDWGIGGVCGPVAAWRCTTEGGAEPRESCAWSLAGLCESGAYDGGLSMSAFPQGGRLNFARTQDLMLAAFGRFQRTIITVSSIIPAHTGPVASQKSRLDIGALSKSFMLFMPKY